jgi:hypothetical protein
MLPLPQIKEIVWYLPFHTAVYVANLWVKYMAKLRKKGSSCTKNIILICCSSDTDEIKICSLHWNCNNIFSTQMNMLCFCVLCYRRLSLFCNIICNINLSENNLHIILSLYALTQNVMLYKQCVLR